MTVQQNLLEKVMQQTPDYNCITELIWLVNNHNDAFLRKVALSHLSQLCGTILDTIVSSVSDDDDDVAIEALYQVSQLSQSLPNLKATVRKALTCYKTDDALISHKDGWIGYVEYVSAYDRTDIRNADTDAWYFYKFPEGEFMDRKWLTVYQNVDSLANAMLSFAPHQSWLYLSDYQFREGVI